jgi:hypothetical protein
MIIEIKAGPFDFEGVKKYFDENPDKKPKYFEGILEYIDFGLNEQPFMDGRVEEGKRHPASHINNFWIIYKKRPSQREGDYSFTRQNELTYLNNLLPYSP